MEALKEGEKQAVEACLNMLKEEGMAEDNQVFWHEPVFTADAQQEALTGKLSPDQVLVKNLFLKEKKSSQLYLVVLRSDTKAELKTLASELGTKAGNLRFASDDVLKQVLNVDKGEVTPLALMNDVDRKVVPVFEKCLEGVQAIVVHPMTNSASISISMAKLEVLLKKWTYEARYVNMSL
mmetsp:Transcript_41594/g.107643  ORF Transcript_41594/g.107643 Transcript_41594/m.107643 type:complete len:180 (-) Transcript_41594:184-723(-)